MEGLFVPLVFCRIAFIGGFVLVFAPSSQVLFYPLFVLYTMGRKFSDYIVNPHTFIYTGRFVAYRLVLDPTRAAQRQTVYAVHMKLSTDSRIDSYFIGSYANVVTGVPNIEVTIRLKKEENQFYVNTEFVRISVVCFPATYIIISCFRR